MYNRGTKYLEKGKALKAIQCFKKAAQTHIFKELYLNMGNAYRLLDKDTLALDAYTTANAPSTPFADGSFAPAYTLALNNIGLLSYAHGEDETAISLYKQCLSIDPMHYDAIWNYANALLRSSNCSSEVGWKAYEYRFKRSGAAVKLDTSIPYWDGITCGNAICVQTEQGLGDKIMFGRYLNRLRDYFKEIYVVCHPSLDCFFSDYKIIRSTAECNVNFTVGICSLAQWFGVVPADYLNGKFTANEFNPDTFNVGVVWSGSSTHVNNRNRSCPSHYFSALADIGSLYSLNPDADADAVKWAKNIATKDWGTTASNILGLDLVISVDTSIVHLCGTLGVPCIMIQPLKETDFRWGRPGDKNVWYPSVEVLENKGWEVAIARVKAMALKKRDALQVRLLTGVTEAKWMEALAKQKDNNV